MNKKLFFALVIFRVVFVANAQQIYMRKIQHPQGIQAHDIYSVFEDSKHYLWFTTDAGVWRFDGKNYTNYTTENGLPDNVVFLFFEDHLGRTWFDTYSSRIAYIEKDSVHTLPCNDSLSKLKKTEIVSNIYIDANAVVWVSYFGSGDYIAISPPYKTENIRTIPVTSDFFAIQVGPGGMIAGSSPFASSKSDGTFSILKEGNTIASGINTSMGSPGLRTSCYKQPDGSFLISAHKCLWEYKDEKLLKKTALNYTILSALKDSYKNYWISTIDGGLFFFRSIDSTFSKPEVYLKGKTVGRVIQDLELSYWITTLNEGIYYIPHIDLKLLNAHNGLNDNISYVFSDPAQNLVLCTDTKGKLYIIRNGILTKTIDCSFKSDKVNIIKKIIKTKKDTYLFLGRHSFMLNEKTGSIRFICPMYEGVTAACYDRKTLWVAQQSHLLKIDPESLARESDTTVGAKINDIYSQSDSILWLSTERGLIIYDRINNRVKQAPSSVKGQGIVSIIRLNADKYLIIYKSEGILIVSNDLKAIKWLLVDVKGYSIKHVTKDAFANTWISTNKGILKIDPQLKISTINEQHGLPSNIINAIGTDSSLVYVACEKGLAKFPITKEFINSTPPDIYLNEILVNNLPHHKDTLLHLGYDQNFIKVSFTAISYRSNNDIECRYKMEGVDDKFKSTQNNEIEYTTLPPGNYTLTLYAVNNDQVSSNKLYVYLTIAPPFWKTWWFIITCVVSLMTGILVLFRWRVFVIRKRTKEKSDLQEQLGQMEMQALRSQMNPHFIFNAINSIQHYILANEPLLANKYLVKFSKLVRNVLEQSKQELISLKEEIETLNFYVEIESLRFEDSFSYQLNISGTIATDTVKIPSLVLQPYVENAIWHGLLLKKGKKELTINISEKARYLIIEIDDNGIGRKASAFFGDKESKKRSLGMEITQNRLDLVNRSLGLKMEVAVIDKTNDQGEALGTTIIIKTPLLS